MDLNREGTITARVANSVALLDTYGPADWRTRIDLDTLDIYNPWRCIGGQVYEREGAQYWQYAPDVYGEGYPGYAVLKDLAESLGIEYGDWLEHFAFTTPMSGLDTAWREYLSR